MNWGWNPTPQYISCTIGNFSKQDDDVAFLKSLPLDSRRGDTLLIRMDRIKPADIIERAYGFAAAEKWIIRKLWKILLGIMNTQNVL
ncbi:hypothetical protein CVT25_007950 [Psilocybe cyanescens]|uniref:Histidine-specific methyltransferase SAM-dependent domain-containing protein n=1 Tax=Psilocybe cyanescens TaxID=93625 RepID=A0A409WCT5_PSICY|nr:hypothetical protein CVT25_007950 [Psilocybe cyanescens]